MPADSRSAPETTYGPLAPPRSLTQELFGRLSADIVEGRLAPGERLPSEHALMRSFAVSRTVVREAVAQLKAEGLVMSRQGLGMFVARDLGSRPFRLADSPADSAGKAVQVMELRMGVEIEAASLAALHRSNAQLAQMRAALGRIDRAIERDQPAVEQDFELHRAIAAATGNAYFVRLLDHLGHYIIPRWVVRRRTWPAGDQKPYLRAIQQEHRLIVERIAAGDAEGARAAMRVHLSGSRDRYKAVATEATGAAAAKPRTESRRPTGKPSGQRA